MNVDYNDERFQRVEQERQEELQNNQAIYDSMINESQQHYKDLENQVAAAGQKQQELQQQRSDLEVQQLNQNKEWAKQDYEKEQKAAYVDYNLKNDDYGENAHRMAQMGLENSGYSESSRVSMWNTYQNRYATARDSFNRANTQYDMAISQAKLSNDSTLANIALETLQSQLQYALEGFQYKNNLLLQQLNDKNNITDRYYSRWKDTLAQINYENELAEQQRQFEEQMAAQRSRSSGGSGGGGYTFTKDGVVYNQNGEIVGYEDGGSSNNGGYFIDGQGRVVTTDANGNVNIWDTNESKSNSSSKSSKSSSKSKKATSNDVLGQVVKQAATAVYNPSKAIMKGYTEVLKAGLNNTINSIKKLTTKKK